MIVCNLFGGPGVGKSTLAAGVFYSLKSQGIKVELVTEVAKDFTWAKRWNCLDNQPLVFGLQLDRIFKLQKQVDIAITDSPILLSAVYGKNKWGENFPYFVLDTFNKFDNINFLISRVKPYRTEGRSQDITRAENIHNDVQNTLEEYEVPYVIVDGNEEGKDYIVQRLLERLVEVK